MMDNTIGIFPDIDVGYYHADMGSKVPILSASRGKCLVPKRAFTTTPMHCALEIPALNPKWARTNSRTFDKGNAMHELILQRGRGLVVLEHSNYLTKAAKAERDAAYDGGKTPVLREEYESMCDAKAVADILLKQSPWGHPFQDGKAEVALRWIEKTKWGDVQCKALVDWLPNKQPLERGIDYKSTGATANPEWWDKRQLHNLGYDISAAFHRRGYRALGLAHDCDYLWVVQEWNAPYACSIVGYNSEELDKAEADIQCMIETFGKCLHTKTWPGYDMEPWFAKRPKWTEYNIRIEGDGHLSSEDIAARL